MQQDIIIQIGTTQFISIFVSLAIMLISIAWVLNGKFGKIERALDEHTVDIKEIKNDNKQYAKDIATLQANVFAHSVSPIKLKDQYRQIIMNSDLVKQIDEKKSELIDIIQKEQPPTPLDAQEVIHKNILEIMKLFDLRDYKFKLYDGGVSTGAEDIILEIYLYEVIIPNLKFPDDTRYI
jgi:hypothetical protein